MNNELLKLIAESYLLGNPTLISVSPLGEGLIHQTFLLENETGSWVLQGFNAKVFRFPERIAHNLAILSGLHKTSPLPFSLPLPLLNKDGLNLTNIRNKYYRLFDFVKGKTIQQIEEPHQAYVAAKAYGVLAAWAKDQSAEELQETIPGFHRLDLRYDRLVKVAGQADALTDEEKTILDFYLGQSELIEGYREFLQLLPMRLTHNDTKINNLIFDNELKQVEALIDLDTLMGGYLLYDFGDLVRTVACTAPETSEDWTGVKLDAGVFRSLLQGYWEAVAGFCSEEEASSLLMGGEVMTCLMGIRFFTDHLEGNVYYKVTYPAQNFHRAKNQMLLLKSQQDLREPLAEIWKEITGSLQ